MASMNNEKSEEKDFSLISNSNQNIESSQISELLMPIESSNLISESSLIF